MEEYQKIYKSWLEDSRLSDEGRAELLAIADDEKEKEYRFGGKLAFGTAGMRGIIGFGALAFAAYMLFVKKSNKKRAHYRAK